MDEPLRLHAAFTTACEVCFAPIPRGAVLIRLGLAHYCCGRCLSEAQHKARARQASAARRVALVGALGAR